MAMRAVVFNCLSDTFAEVAQCRIWNESGKEKTGECFEVGQPAETGDVLIVSCSEIGTMAF